MRPQTLIALSLPLLLCSLVLAAPADRTCRVDAEGVLRWQDDNSEVCLFGVNLCSPFCQEYGDLKSVGADVPTDRELPARTAVALASVIAQDILHLQRLGVTSLRIPVWDREISDHEGNLLENEHLALLDHMIAEAKRRGICFVLTPMVQYATPNESPGFSSL